MTRKFLIGAGLGLALLAVVGVVTVLIAGPILLMSVTRSPLPLLLFPVEFVVVAGIAGVLSDEI